MIGNNNIYNLSLIFISFFDKMNIQKFRDLPEEIQLYIGKFLPLWQKMGLTSPPIFPKNERKKYKIS